MGALQRRNDAFQAAEQLDAFQRLVVGGIGVLGAAQVAQPGVLRPDAGVVQPGADAVGERDLAVVILQHIALGALEHAETAQLRIGETRGVLAAGDAAAAGLDADQTHLFMLEEGVEDADGVAAAAHAGHDGIGQAAGPVLGSSIWSMTLAPMMLWKSRTMAG